MDIFNIKNIRQYKDDESYLENINKKELKKCILVNKEIRKKYEIYYKKDAIVIPFRGNLTPFQIKLLVKHSLLKTYHMFVIKNKETNEENRWLYDNYAKFPIFPKKVIDLELNEELIYQLDKEMNKIKQKRNNNSKIIDLDISSYFYKNRYKKGDVYGKTISVFKQK